MINEINNKHSVESLEAAIIQWAKNKEIPLVPTNALNQMRKTIEELEELDDEIIKHMVGINNIPSKSLKMELGDVLVTLVLQAAIWDTSFQECMQLALDKISTRTGKTIDGIFVKDGD